MSVSKRKQVRLPGYTPEPQHAKELGVELGTLQKKRRLGETCAYIRIGRQVYYVDEDKERWLRSLRVTPPRSGQSKTQRRHSEEASA
jgi:hypothetical protein